MTRKKKRFFENVLIERVADKGRGLAHLPDGKVVLVDYAVPGDIVDVHIYRNKKDYGLGKIYRLVVRSADRTKPFCSHFGVCGGCRWQHVPYAVQLQYKQQLVEEAFKRIGKLKKVNIEPIIGAERTEYYRNKLEFSFTARRWLTDSEIKEGIPKEIEPGLGFHVPLHFDKIVDITQCYLQPEPSNAIRLAVKKYANAHQLSFYDVKNRIGLLRSLILRNSSLNEWMLVLCLSQEKKAVINGLFNHLASLFPEIISFNYVINTKVNDALFDLEIIHHSGKPFITETINGIMYNIGPKTFFQTHTKQAERLYQLTNKLAALSGNEVVYDLFTGAGSIAIYLANYAKTLVGVDVISEAIIDAKKNAQLNSLSNCFFETGKVKDLFNNEFLKKYGAPDVIILDPPRAGLHKQVTKQLLDVQTKKVVYISCNPATQARDVQLLSKNYNLTVIQPIDLFPHSYHVENVVVLDAKT